MIPFPSATDEMHELIAAIPVREGFDIAWAGTGGPVAEFCLGSEHGDLEFIDATGHHRSPLASALPSKEAINGGAFVGQWMCVSTRHEILLLTLPTLTGTCVEQALIPIGAHDVIASSSGNFFAPLGPAGLLHFKPSLEGNHAVTVSSPLNGETLYVYRVISLPAPGAENEIIACAIRQGGIAAGLYRGGDEELTFRTRVFKGMDVVDICPLNDGSTVCGAVALGRDGTLIIFRHVLDDAEPRTIRYLSLKGVPYRVWSANGQLVVLTSKGLYFIGELIYLALNGKKRSYHTPVLTVEMQAVDATLIRNRWLLVVLPEGLLRVDVSLLGHFPQLKLAGKDVENAEAVLTYPEIVEREIEQSGRQLDLAIAG